MTFSMSLRFVMTILMLLAGVSAHAQECSLTGTVKNDQGVPAAGISVTVTRSAAFRGLTRQVVTGADGTFVLTGLPCGTYMVLAHGSYQPLTIDIKKEPSISLVVDRRSTEAAVMMREFENARQAAHKRLRTPDEVDDERVAAAYRARFVASAGSSVDRQVYERAKTDEEKVMVFVMAAARHVAEAIDPQSLEHEPQNSSRRLGLGRFLPRRGSPLMPGEREDDLDGADRIARRQLEATRALIARELSPAAAQAFLTDSYREQTRKALEVTRRIWQRTEWPAATVLVATDSNFGASAKAVVGQALGEDSREFREWDDHLSPRWRGAAYHRAMLSLLDDAVVMATGQAPSPALSRTLDDTFRTPDLLTPIAPRESNDKRAAQYEALRREMAQRHERERILRPIALAFGKSAAEDYRRQTSEGQRELRALAAAMALSRSASIELP